MITINQNEKQKNDIKKIPKEIIDPYYFSNKELYEIYLKSLPPPDAYLYFPKGEEVMIPNDKRPEKALRRIFLGVPYTEIEENWIKEFKAEIALHPEMKLPDYWNDAINLRFVYATECNIKKSYERLERYFQWDKSYFPMVIQPGDKTFQLLNIGFLYIYGRDHQFRPIIICEPNKFQKYMKSFTSEEVIKASVFLFRYLVNNMLIPGQIENWIMILNFEGTSPLSLPDAVKKLIKTVSENFLSRLYKCYVLGMSFVINILYKIICNFLEEITIQKLNVLDDKNSDKLFESIRKDNIEQKFGGTAPDLVGEIPNSLFPPRMPSSFFLKEDEDPKQILLSEEEYIELVENGKIPEYCISPYLREKLEIREKQKAFELQLKNYIHKTEWKFQNEFEGKNKSMMKKSKHNFVYDLKAFNLVKNSFRNSINLINDMK
jgi:hypothetical protein